MFHLSIIESVIFVYGISTVWEVIDGCANQYRCGLAIYLITVLSSSYVIILECAINAPDHNNIVDGLNGSY